MKMVGPLPDFMTTLSAPHGEGYEKPCTQEGEGGEEGYLMYPLKRLQKIKL